VNDADPTSSDVDFNADRNATLHADSERSNIIHAELEAINERIGDAKDDKSASPKSPFGVKPEEKGRIEDYSEPREIRRSPASIIGSKRIGATQLPSLLVEQVSNAVDGMFKVTLDAVQLTCRGQPQIYSTRVPQAPPTTHQGLDTD
jgi:hypothetical protein